MAIKSSGKKRSKSGAPSKLTLENATKALELSRRGYLDKQVCKILKISPSSLCLWKNRFSEFSEAFKESKEVCLDRIEAAQFRAAEGFHDVEERISVNKNGKVTRSQVVRYYAPNPASAGLLLRAWRPNKYKPVVVKEGSQPTAQVGDGVKPFPDFCKDAGYPLPFPKQEEMRAFLADEDEARLLLGARGYGKTDYVTILGVAYEIYRDYQAHKASLKTDEPKPLSDTTLIVTKSQERNAAMLEEIAKACKANGVPFEKETAGSLRVTGLIGKDHTVSAITIGTKSVRGRHPKRTVMDDPVTEDDDSPATRKRVQKLYNELHKLCSNILIIGQPVHKFDLYETLRPLIKKMEVPHGSIPELDHDLEAQRIAGVSEESIQASYFLKVISETGFPLEKVKFLDAWEKAPCVAFIDPSFEGGDYTALTIAKAHFEGVAVLGKVYKRAWYDCLDEMAKVMEGAGVQRVCFETNALGDQPVTMLRDVLTGGIGVVGKKSNGNKHSRILAAAPFAPMIHIAKTSDRLYIDQVTKYEYGAKNDDAPDSLASCLEWLGLIRGKANQK